MVVLGVAMVWCPVAVAGQYVPRVQARGRVSVRAAPVGRLELVGSTA